MPQSLRLWIVSCSCSCSYKWTHSYVTFSNGGTPSPSEEKAGPLTAISEAKRQFSYCFRCAPITLPRGWEEAKAQPKVGLDHVMAKLFED